MQELAAEHSPDAREEPAVPASRGRFWVAGFCLFWGFFAVYFPIWTLESVCLTPERERNRPLRGAALRIAHGNTPPRRCRSRPPGLAATFPLAHVLFGETESFPPCGIPTSA